MGNNEGCADLLWRRAITAMAIKAVSSARPPTIQGHHASVSVAEGEVSADGGGGAEAGGAVGAALSCGPDAPSSADGAPRALRFAVVSMSLSRLAGAGPAVSRRAVPVAGSLDSGCDADGCAVGGAVAGRSLGKGGRCSGPCAAGAGGSSRKSRNSGGVWLMGGASVCCACRADAPAMDVNARKKIRWAWLVITRLPSPAPLNFG
ncbi:MAG: hypothetical protein RSE16_01260 [Sphingobium sp.]|nr:MAG: hypothetical protein RSE16_01260 [Sphingobium sp.]